MAQAIKNLPAMQKIIPGSEMWIQSLDQEDPDRLW